MTLNGLQRNSPDGEQCQGHYQPKQDQASEHRQAEPDPSAEIALIFGKPAYKN